MVLNSHDNENCESTGEAKKKRHTGQARVGNINNTRLPTTVCFFFFPHLRALTNSRVPKRYTSATACLKRSPRFTYEFPFQFFFSFLNICFCPTIVKNQSTVSNIAPLKYHLKNNAILSSTQSTARLLMKFVTDTGFQSSNESITLESKHS